MVLPYHFREYAGYHYRVIVGLDSLSGPFRKHFRVFVGLDLHAVVELQAR